MHLPFILLQVRPLQPRRRLPCISSRHSGIAVLKHSLGLYIFQSQSRRVPSRSALLEGTRPRSVEGADVDFRPHFPCTAIDLPHLPSLALVPVSTSRRMSQGKHLDQCGEEFAPKPHAIETDTRWSQAC